MTIPDKQPAIAIRQDNPILKVCRFHWVTVITLLLNRAANNPTKSPNNNKNGISWAENWTLGITGLMP